MRPARLALLAGLIAAVAGPALAQAEHKPPSFSTPPPKLRGPQVPLAAPPPVQAYSRQPDQSLDPSLVPPVDTAARLGGLEQERAGGALCRQACAQTYYFCLTNEEAQSCAASWSSCLSACPSNSSRQ